MTSGGSFSPGMDAAPTPARLAEARARLSAAVNADPDDVEARANLGGVLMMLGLAEDGIAMLAEAVRRKPGHLKARYNLGQACLEAGRLDEAEKHLARVAKKAKGNADVLAAWGAALARLGREGKAIPVLRQALQAAPGHPKALDTLAGALLRHGKRAEAIEMYRQAAAARPDDARAHYNLGLAYAANHRPHDATLSYERALALDPGFTDAHTNLGNLMAERGWWERAVKHLEIALAATPDSPQALFNLGNARMLGGELDGARAAFDALIDRDPTDELGYQGVILAYQSEGRFDEAARFIDRLDEAAPGSPNVAVLRSLNGKGALAPDDLDALEVQARKPDLPVPERAKLWFALGKAHADAGTPEAAFKAYRKGNELVATSYGDAYDPAEDEALIDLLAGVYTPDGFAHMAGMGTGDPSEQPVFVVGMPRSGTTLTEQIIASHPDASGAGELTAMDELANDMQSLTGTGFPACLPALTPAVAKRLRDAYLAALRRNADNPDAARITDKMPNNYWHLGLIAVMFPKAKIIHCRRDPMATGLSIYFRNFAGFHPWAYDLKAIGRRIRAYRRLMDHWRAALPAPILEVDYEDMVADQEGQSRRILDFIGLPWDDRVLAFHKTERRVRTASQWQVRQPMYTGSVAMWKAYEPWLAPLAEQLKEGA